MAIEKIKILGAVLELPAKQHCQFSPFGPLYEVNGLDWQCYLAGSSKMSPRILIFSIAIGADCSYEVKNSEIQAPTFFKHNNSFIATVVRKQYFCLEKEKQKFSSMTSTRLFQNKEACITQKLFRNELPSTSSENSVLYRLIIIRSS